MTLRKSLATGEWHIQEYEASRPLSTRFCVFENGRDHVAEFIAGDLTKENAAAIAALPQFYALALEVLRVPMVDNTSRIVELMAQARAALDAANIQDEPELP